MRILLIIEPSDRTYITMSNMPPLGVLSICAYLREKGLHVDLLTRNVRAGRKPIPSGYDVYGLSINIANLENSMRTIDLVKEKDPGCVVAVGGPICTSDPNRFREKNGVDLIFIGEAEESFYDFIINGTGPELKGVHFRDNQGQWIFNGPHDLIEDLDRLPFPAWDMLNPGEMTVCPRKRRPITGIITSRGCPSHCIFCSKTMGNKWRARSPEDVVDEIQWHMEELGSKEICLWDDNFSLDLVRAERICDLVVERGLRVSLQFPNGLRADRLTEELIRKMKRAGVWYLAVAPETGSERTLKRIGKGLSLESVENAVGLCRKYGISIALFFMIGFPWETADDIEKTIRFARRLGGDLSTFSRVVPLKGTRLFDMIERQGGFRSERIIQTHYAQEQTFINPHLSDREISKYIKKANRRCYLNQKAIKNLLSAFSFRDLARMVMFALRTRNI
ncbi:MAG: radical SAM protein [Candidatus Erginobacter occultus]|nr:radical SAM protein [Candidatus Erginobacter occultus]